MSNGCIINIFCFLPPFTTYLADRSYAHFRKKCVAGWPSGNFLDEKRRITRWTIPLSWWGQNLICLGVSSLWTYEELNKVGGDIFGSYLRGRSDCSLRQFQLTTVREELQLPCLSGQMWLWVSHRAVVHKKKNMSSDLHLQPFHQWQPLKTKIRTGQWTEKENYCCWWAGAEIRWRDFPDSSS